MSAEPATLDGWRQMWGLHRAFWNIFGHDTESGLVARLSMRQAAYRYAWLRGWQRIGATLPRRKVASK